MSHGHLTREEVDYLTEMFHQYDAECQRDGSLSLHELHRMAKDFALKIPDRQFVDWFNEFDKDGSGSLSLNEFIQIFARVPRSEIKEAEKERIFRDLDADGSGFVTPQEIMEVCTKNGISTSEGEINDMMSKIDKDSDGKLSVAEFKVLWETMAG